MDNKPSALTRTSRVPNGAADDPAQLRAEIAETRNEMSQTIEELHGRLNPAVLKQQALDQFHEATETVKQELKERLHEVRGDVIDEIDTVKAKINEEIGNAKAAVREATIGKVENMMQGARDRVRGASRSVKDVVADNPIPAALAGLGLAWLFIESRRQREDDRLFERERRERRMLSERSLEAERYPTRTIREGVGVGVQQDQDQDRSIGQQIKDAGQQAGRKVADVAQDAKETVSDVTHRAQAKASELTRDAGRQARRVQRRGGEVYRSNPIALGTAALAAGTLVGLAMPRTRRENEWFGDKRDDVVDKAQELAHQAIGKADEAVKKAGERDEAQEKEFEPSAIIMPGDEYH